VNPHSSSPDATGWARRLKIRHLEYFLILKDSGTLSEAASRIHMTQSAMSHWLGELESLAGVKLVQRGRQIKLTAAGEALRRLAVRVLGDVARTHDELEVIAQGATASLHIGSVTAGIAHLIPDAITQFQREHGNVQVRMSEGAFNLLLQGLEKRELDLVVGSIDARAYGENLLHEVLFEDSIVAIVGPQHSLARKKARLDWPDLFAYPWIMPPRGTLMRSRLETVLLERGGAGIRPQVETASTITIESMLRQTDCVSVCSGSLGAHLHEVGVVRALPLTLPFGPVGAVIREGEDHPQVQQFLAVLRRQAGGRPAAP
jgi:DNA-binding transcriptional LysR family regulator